MSDVIELKRHLKDPAASLQDSLRAAVYAMVRDNPEMVLREIAELRQKLRDIEDAARRPLPQIAQMHGYELSRSGTINVTLDDYDRWKRMEAAVRKIPESTTQKEE